MKTEYQARFPNSRPTEWIKDVDYLRENARHLLTAQLWRRETETPEEAAVRQMAALGVYWEKANSGQCVAASYQGETIAQFADRLSPPPPTTETQIDWDTLEPIKEVPVHKMDNGLFIAGVDYCKFEEMGVYSLNVNLTHGDFAIGSTRENALRNLRELQEAKKL
jgi:hypothetical protein